MTGVSDGLVEVPVVGGLLEESTSERIGVVIFLVVVAFLVVVVVAVVAMVAVVALVAVVAVATVVGVVATVVVVFGGIPVGPTPILNPLVTQSSNSCFLSTSSTQILVQVSVRLGQMTNRAYTDYVNYQD